MSSALMRSGLIAMIALSVLTGLYSLRFAGVPFQLWLGIDRDIAGVIHHVPLQALTHMIVAPIALLSGPFQFIQGLRRARPGLHRWLGRTYVAACLVAGIAALATVPFASGGPVAGLGFGMLAVVWVVTTFRGWRAAVNRDFPRHKRLMLYSYAMTFAGVTLRLQIPLGFALGYASYSAMSVWLAYTAWIPNIVVMWLWLNFRHGRQVAVT